MISTHLLFKTDPLVIAIQAGNPSPLAGLLLTTNDRVPVGKILTFFTLQSVSDYFGSSATETAQALIYFTGSQKSTQLPSKLYIANMPHAAVAAWLRGGAVTDLASLTALATAQIIVEVDSVAVDTGPMDFTGAASFSDIAVIIEAVLTGTTVTYDSIAKAFLITSSRTGAGSSIGFATGTSAAILKLNTANAVQSLGSDAAVTSDFMDSITNLVRDWTTFTTLFTPTDEQRLEFEQWTHLAETYAFITSSSDAEILNPASTTDSSVLLNGFSVVVGGIPTYTVQPTYALDNTLAFFDSTSSTAMFLMGCAAALDVTLVNGWQDFAYIFQAGLPATVTSDADYDTCRSKRTNFYGSWTDNNYPQFFFDGSISGKFRWFSDFLASRLICYQLEAAWVSLKSTTNSLPFNDDSRAQIIQYFRDNVMIPAVSLGAINSGIVLDKSQILQIESTSEAKDIVTEIQQRGFFIEVQSFTAQQRAIREAIPKFWFTTGGSILTAYAPVYLVE